MDIACRLGSTSIVGRPFADFLNVSVPVEHADALREAVVGTLDALGNFQESSPGYFEFFSIGVKKGSFVAIPCGSVKFGRRGKVATLSASGGALKLLRERSLLSEYLSAIGTLPHRVTMLHCTADYLVPDVPAAVQAYKNAAFAGELSLTRKRVLPTQCKTFFGIDCDGKETGSLYLGQRANADVWCKIYDKRHERLSKGFAEPGSLLRVEVACMSDVGATLRDAADPFDLFFHYAGRTLVEAPVEASGWAPHGEGYVLGERVERSLFEKFENLVVGSQDILRLARMGLELYGAKVAAQAVGRRVLALVGVGA